MASVNNGHRVVGSGSQAVKINKIILKAQNERGRVSEAIVYRALCILRDQYNVPIILTRSQRGDRKDSTGIDIEIKGRKPLNAWFGIDVKGSESGMRAYMEKQKQLGQIRLCPPRYPFLFKHQSGLELELLKFILEKSNSHKHLAELAPSFSEIMGPDYHHNLRWFIDHLFSH